MSNRYYKSFRDARKYMHEVGLQSIKEWRAWNIKGARPSFIPAAPGRHYEKEGFLGFPDFLGYHTPRYPRRPRSSLAPISRPQGGMQSIAARGIQWFLEKVSADEGRIMVDFTLAPHNSRTCLFYRCRTKQCEFSKMEWEDKWLPLTLRTTGTRRSSPSGESLQKGRDRFHLQFSYRRSMVGVLHLFVALDANLIFMRSASQMDARLNGGHFPRSTHTSTSFKSTDSISVGEVLAELQNVWDRATETDKKPLLDHWEHLAKSADEEMYQKFLRKLYERVYGPCGLTEMSVPERDAVGYNTILDGRNILHRIANRQTVTDPNKRTGIPTEMHKLKLCVGHHAAASHGKLSPLARHLPVDFIVVFIHAGHLSLIHI